MLTRLFLLSLWMLAAVPVLAAPVGAPQDLVYQDEDGEGDPRDSSGQLAAPPPALHMPAQPMGSSPLNRQPPLQVVPAPAPQPTPVFTPTIIGAPVEQDELAAPVLTSYGILDERSGSMPMDIWKALSYDEAIGTLTTSIQLLRSASTNLAFKDTLRAAALSKTYEPTGNAARAQEFFNQRVMAAQIAGDREGAFALLNTHADSFKPNDWQTFIETDIRMGHAAQACDAMALKLAPSTNNFAQKLAILCNIKEGKADAARLNLDVLREAGETDALFLDLAERALSPNVAPKKQKELKLENLGALHIAEIAMGKIKIKPEQVDGLMNPPLPIILDIGMPDAQRLKYAELFARQRLISAETFNAIVASVKFPPKSIAGFRAKPETLLTMPEKEWPAPLRRAAALRAIVEEDNPSTKAHIIEAALAGFSNADLLGAVGDTLHADVAGLSALPDNLPAAPAMARLLLLRGDKDAQSWWHLASAAPANREALLPLFPLALLRGVLSDDERQTWFENYGRTQMMSGEKKSFNMALVKILGVMLPSDMDSQLAAQNVFPAMTPNDRKISSVLSNLARDSNEVILRAVLGLKMMRQDALAEKAALLKL